MDKSLSRFPFVFAAAGHPNCVFKITYNELIKITKGRIFCKQGAEGVLLFSDMKNKYGGILKVKDGNNRAIPSATIKLLRNIKSITKNEVEKLKKWDPEFLYNHSNKKIGLIKS